MSDWTPHADAVVRAVPEDEAIRAVRDALEKRYRALVARLREAGDETWADNLSGYNSYRMEPAKCSLAVLEMMVEEIHSLRNRGVEASMRLRAIKKLHQPTTIPERRDLVCQGRHGIWMHWPCMEARALGAREGDSDYDAT